MPHFRDLLLYLLSEGALAIDFLLLGGDLHMKLAFHLLGLYLLSLNLRETNALRRVLTSSHRRVDYKLCRSCSLLIGNTPPYVCAAVSDQALVESLSPPSSWPTIFCWWETQ